MGILSEWNYDEVELKFCSKGSVLIHTDGIVSCVNEEGDAISQLSLEGCIFQALQERKPAAEILMQALKDHSPMPILQDDMTLISIDRKR